MEPNISPQHGDLIISANKDKATVAIAKYFVEIDQIYLKPSSSLQNAIPMSDSFVIIGVIVQYKKDLKL